MHNVTSTTFCDDLEQLLETGYAELIKTGFGDGVDGEHEGEMAVVLDESPFPKGMKVFDGDADQDDNSPFEDEFDSGYEVICAREIVQIPVYAGGCGSGHGGAAVAGSATAMAPGQTMIG